MAALGQPGGVLRLLGPRLRRRHRRSRGRPAGRERPARADPGQIDAGAARSTVSHHGHGGDLTAAEAVAAASGPAAVDRPGQGDLLLGLAGAALLSATASGVHLARRIRGGAVSA
ncbi:hypothetical protein [Kitasatospora fiedleri]|uniref:hypothetical protein n=1 Tax=Kitasatospora fiedleri TaxID=2991545 RepID=UPI00249B3147|nr:hypothetical protein [Kitasatospora fiedleri]